MARGRSLMGDNGLVLNLLIAVPSGTVKDDTVQVGGISGVALTDRDANGNASIAIRPAQVFRCNVTGSTDVDTSPLSAAAAVALGDKLYVEAASEVISKDVSDDQFFGYALGTRDSNGAYTAAADAVASGATSECDVLLGA